MDEWQIILTRLSPTAIERKAVKLAARQMVAHQEWARQRKAQRRAMAGSERRKGRFDLETTERAPRPTGADVIDAVCHDFRRAIQLQNCAIGMAKHQRPDLYGDPAVARTQKANRRKR